MAAATLDLDKLVLAHGAHKDRSNGLCVMEAVAWAAGREHTDRPPCVSPVIGAFLRSWNDSLPDDDRQMLKRFVFPVIGTNTGRRDEEKRAWLATDWLARECAPAFLRLAGLTVHAESLEGLAALTGARPAKAAQPKIDAARAAAWDAAGAAAGAAARAAAGDAARDAAWAAAGAAARAAARDAARDAGRDALAPTVKQLQASALLLVDRMIAVGKET